jgi:hypothetical protein
MIATGAAATAAAMPLAATAALTSATAALAAMRLPALATLLSGTKLHLEQ